MVCLLALYILLGAVMDELAMLLLTLPVFFPIVQALDFGLPPDEVAIWFGILVLIVVGIGLTAPPIGLNVFVISSIAQERADRRDLSRRAAVHRHGHRPARPGGRLPGTRAVAGARAQLSRLRPMHLANTAPEET